MNIIFGALAIAIGVSTTINQLFSLQEYPQIHILSILFVMLGVSISIVGLYWIITSANILDFTTDIQIDRHKQKKTLDEEIITRLIVQMVAFYRKNKKSIRQMIVMSRMGGCLFICFTFVSLVDLFVLRSVSITNLSIIEPIRLCLMFLLGITCLFIPRFFIKYASIWDHRMMEAKLSEKTFMEQMRSP